MEYLVHYIKDASLLPLAFTALALIASVVLFPVGIWIALRAKSKVTLAIYLVLAFVPLTLCLVGAGTEFFLDQRGYQLMEGSPSQYIDDDRADYAVQILIGVALTLPLFLIGSVGLVLKRKA